MRLYILRRTQRQTGLNPLLHKKNGKREEKKDTNDPFPHCAVCSPLITGNHLIMHSCLIFKWADACSKYRRVKLGNKQNCFKLKPGMFEKFEWMH